MRERQLATAAARRGETAPAPTQPGQMQVIYHTLTGKTFTRQDLLRTLPTRLIAVFQPDSTPLVGSFNSEWMAKRWQTIVQCLEIASTVSAVSWFT